MTDDYTCPAPGPSPLTCGRQPLVEAITRFLAHGHAPGMPEIRASIERAIDEAGPAAIDGLARRLAAAGSDWSYYPSDPLARRIHHVLARQVLQHEPVVIGAEQLDELTERPVAIYANHLRIPTRMPSRCCCSGRGRDGSRTASRSLPDPRSTRTSGDAFPASASARSRRHRTAPARPRRR